MRLWKRITDWARNRAYKDVPEGLQIAGTFKGHTIWAWNQIGYLPADRYLVFLQNQREAELGVSDTDLKAFINGVRNANNAGDKGRVGWFVETLDFYLQAHAPERMLFKTGAVLLLIDDEPPTKISERHMKLKADLFEADKEFRAFFLDTLYARLRDYGVLSSGIAREDFLKEADQTAERIYSILTGKDTFSDYLNA